MGLFLGAIALDMLSLYFIMLAIGRKKKSRASGAVKWLSVMFIFCWFAQTQLSMFNGFIDSIQISRVELLPVNAVVGIVGLLFLTLIMNSITFNTTHIEVIFMTMLGYTIWLLLRLFSIAIIEMLSMNELIFRPISFVLVLVFYWLVTQKYAVYIRNDYNLFAKLMIATVFGFLLYMAISMQHENSMIIHPIVLEFIVVLTLFLLGWLFYEQKRIQVMDNRMKATEKYIPIIDELVAEVRARQHEFANKLVAISSIMHATDDIKVAREQVSKYVGSVQLTMGQQELLNLDHKVLAGFLYTKMKRAEQLNIHLQIERTISVSAFPCEDYDLIEILGILIDNALEASYREEQIIVNMTRSNNRYELTVSNRSEQMTNEQFMQLFKLGYSTKSTYSNHRGFGLYNVKQLAVKYNGKIIARNEQRNGNMVTIGVQF